MIAFLAPEQSIAISRCNQRGSLDVGRPRSGLSFDEYLADRLPFRAF
jgi:hypothetical protein